MKEEDNLNLIAEEDTQDVVTTTLPRGRKKKAISKKQFEELCNIFCTEDEICSVLDVTVKTLNRWCMEEYGDIFSKIRSRMQDKGKASLRRSQKRMSEYNPKMAIFLGKQYLGQSEEPQRDNANNKLDDFTNALMSAYTNRQEDTNGTNK